MERKGTSRVALGVRSARFLKGVNIVNEPKRRRKGHKPARSRVARRALPFDAYLASRGALRTQPELALAGIPFEYRVEYVWRRLEAQSDELLALCGSSEDDFRRAAQAIFSTLAPVACGWNISVVFENDVLTLILSPSYAMSLSYAIDRFARRMPDSLRTRWRVTKGYPAQEDPYAPAPYAEIPGIRPEKVRVQLHWFETDDWGKGCWLYVWSKELGEIRRTDPDKAYLYAEHLINNTLGEDVRLRYVWSIGVRGPASKRFRPYFLREFRRFFFQQFRRAKHQTFDGLVAERRAYTDRSICDTWPRRTLGCDIRRGVVVPDLAALRINGNSCSKTVERHVRSGAMPVVFYFDVRSVTGESEEVKNERRRPVVEGFLAYLNERCPESLTVLGEMTGVNQFYVPCVLWNASRVMSAARAFFRSCDAAAYASARVMSPSLIELPLKALVRDASKEDVSRCRAYFEWSCFSRARIARLEEAHREALAALDALTKADPPELDFRVGRFAPDLDQVHYACNDRQRAAMLFVPDD